MRRTEMGRLGIVLTDGTSASTVILNKWLDKWTNQSINEEILKEEMSENKTERKKRRKKNECKNESIAKLFIDWLIGYHKGYL
jgi:hypothetical protein